MLDPKGGVGALFFYRGDTDEPSYDSFAHFVGCRVYLPGGIDRHGWMLWQEVRPLWTRMRQAVLQEAL